MVSKVASSRRVLVFLTQAGVQSWHSNIEVRILRRCVVATVCQHMCHVYLIQAVYLNVSCVSHSSGVPASGACCEHLDLFVMSIWIFLSRAHCRTYG